MMAHGATPTDKCETPAAHAVPWRVFLKEDRAVGIRVEAQSWLTAREIGRPDFSPLLELVDAEPAPVSL